MKTKTKGRAGWRQATPNTSKRTCNYTRVGFCVKTASVMPLFGWFPIAPAERINRMGGPRYECAIYNFREAMHAGGPEALGVIEPGKLRRFSGIGKSIWWAREVRTLSQTGEAPPARYSMTGGRHLRVYKNGREGQGSGGMATAPTADRQHVPALSIVEYCLGVTLTFRAYKLLRKRWEAAV